MRAHRSVKPFFPNISSYIEVLELGHTAGYTSKNNRETLLAFANNEALDGFRNCLKPLGLDCRAVYKGDFVRRGKKVTRKFSEYAVTVEELEVIE